VTSAVAAVLGWIYMQNVPEEVLDVVLYIRQCRGGAGKSGRDVDVKPTSANLQHTVSYKCVELLCCCKNLFAKLSFIFIKLLRGFL